MSRTTRITSHPTAAAVVAQADAWAPVGDVIEATRLAAKKQISEVSGDLAAVETGVNAILAGLSWPSPGA